MKFKLLFSFFLLAFSWQLQAEIPSAGNAQEFSRVIDKNFPLSPDGKLELANKYGRIDISNWDRNEVDIKVRIVVQARNEKEAESVFDRINIAFSNTSNSVRAETEISSGRASSWWSWGSSSNSNEFKIYYEVKMPRGAQLHTQARYCDVRSDALRGQSRFEVKYGKLKLEQTQAESVIDMAYGDIDYQEALAHTEIKLSYGNLKMDKAKTVELYAQYGEAKIREIRDDAKLDARYTNIQIEQAQHLEFRAGYGELQLGSAKSLNGDSNYTDYEIGSISDYVHINTDYGDVEIASLTKGFTKVDIKSTYSSVAIRVDRMAAFALEAQARYADIDYPDDLNISLKEKASNSMRIKGTHAGGGPAVIRLSSNYGDVEVEYR